MIAEPPVGDSTPGEDRSAHFAAVRRVLWGVLVANLAVTGVKITLGLATGALAVVADGFHSLVDSSSNLIGLAAVRLAARPADERHPYGYRRYETVGALAIGGMLLVAAFEIGRAILERLQGGPPPELSALSVALFALTFPINLAIVLLETRQGRRLQSELLLADAAHTRADLFVTASVVISLVGAWLGLPWLDVLVATGVVVLILRAAFSILRSASAWLTDVVVADPEEVEVIAESVPGVLYVHRVRSRGTPDAGFVDLHVKVPPGMSTGQAHAIASEVEKRLKDRLPGVVDALVHIEPGRHDLSTDWERISYDLRQIADGLGVGLHDLHVHADPAGDYAIELHLEIPGEVSLGEAHVLAETFEARVQERWPRARQVITHLEPLTPAVLAVTGAEDGGLEKQVREVIQRTFPPASLLSLHLQQGSEHTSVAVRVGLPAGQTLAEAHQQAEALERTLLSEIGDLDRVTVHVEPEESLP